MKFQDDISLRNIIVAKFQGPKFEQELSHDSIARLNCALPITKTINVIR